MNPLPAAASFFDAQPTSLAGDLVTLRPLASGDFDALYAVASDPLVWEQHPARDRYQEPVFRAFFADALSSGGALLVRDTGTGAVIGSSRYHGWDAARSEVEIGWTFLARACWGGRYNAQLKSLMLQHAFGFVDSVVFNIGAGNMRSRRAVLKLGATQQTMPEGSAAVSYRLRRAHYLAASPAAAGTAPPAPA